MRSRSNAHRRPEFRERFFSPFTVLGIMLVFLLLLALLFPEKNLLAALRRSSEASSLVLCYQESIYRIRPGDTDICLKLAEGLVDRGCFRRAMEVLDELDEGAPRQVQTKALEIRFRALKGLLQGMERDAPVRDTVVGDLSLVIRQLVERSPDPETVRLLAGEAAAAGDQATAKFLLEQYDTPEGALMRGDYRRSARMYFRSMKAARNLAERRELFINGVRALQSGDLIAEALNSGEANIADLISDQKTSLFMTKIALAAGRPDKAQVFIQKALRMDPGQKQAGGGDAAI